MSLFRILQSTFMVMSFTTLLEVHYKLSRVSEALNIQEPEAPTPPQPIPTPRLSSSEVETVLFLA